MRARDLEHQEDQINPAPQHTITYDQLGRVIRVSAELPQANILTTAVYTYDATGRLSEVRQAAAGAPDLFAQHARNQLDNRAQIMRNQDRIDEARAPQRR